MLDQTQLGNLNADQKAAYARHSETFGTAGWNDIEVWANAQAIEQGKRMLSASSWDMYLIARGARAAFVSMAQLQETTEAEFAEFASQNAEQQVTLDEIEHE